jgi:hypothetical protein
MTDPTDTDPEHWLMLWNRNDLLRFRFLLRKSVGSGSGSDSGSDSGSVSGSISGSGSGSSTIQTYSTQFFNNENVLHNLVFSMLEAALFHRNLASNFLFFYFTFYIGSGSKSVSETRMYYFSGSAQAKKLRFLVFQVPAPVPKHCR